MSEPRERRPPRPAPLGRTMLILAGAFASSVALAGWIDAGLDQTLRGRIEAHRTPLVAHASGRITGLRLTPGAEVVAGRAVLDLEDDELRDLVTAAEERVRDLTAEVARTRARVRLERAWRREEIDRRVLETQLRANELIRERFDENLGGLAWSAFARAHGDDVPTPVAFDAAIEERYGAHFVALVRREGKRNAVEVAEAQMSLCEQRLGALHDLREAVDQDVARSHGLDALESELAEAESESRALAGASVASIVAAPAFGQLDELTVAEGETIREGDTLGTIVDRARPFLEVPVASDRLDDFPPGTRMWIEFPGHGKRFGVVRAAAPRRLVRRAERDDPAAATWFLLEVVPDGKLWPELPLGMTVELRRVGAE